MSRSTFITTLLIFCFSVVILLGYISFGVYKIESKMQDNQWFIYENQGVKYNLKVANTPDQHRKGLSEITDIPQDYDGMLFAFDEKEVKTFWNYKTHFPLTVLWMEDFSIVGQSFLPAYDETVGAKTVTSPQKVNYVIEIIEK